MENANAALKNSKASLFLRGGTKMSVYCFRKGSNAEWGELSNRRTYRLDTSSVKS
jgi:hypothetical protein